MSNPRKHQQTDNSVVPWLIVGNLAGGLIGVFSVATHKTESPRVFSCAESSAAKVAPNVTVLSCKKL